MSKGKLNSLGIREQIQYVYDIARKNKGGGDVVVPTKTSDLENDSGFITSSDLPTVGNGTITINQGGSLRGTFTTNQSGNTTIDLSEGLESIDWSDIENKPNFSNVATSGSYTDLTDKPTLFSGDYNDLINKPTIGSDLTFENGLREEGGVIKLGSTSGSTEGYLTEETYLAYVNEMSQTSSMIGIGQYSVALSASNSSRITNIQVPPSGFTISNNDSNLGYSYISFSLGVGFEIGDDQYLKGLKYKNDYSSKGKLDDRWIPDWGAVKSQVTWGNLTDKPDVIAVGATKEEARTAIGAGTSNFSGSYEDLTNKPTIPTKTSDLTNDSGFSTFSGNYNDLTNKPTIYTEFKTISGDSILGSGDLLPNSVRNQRNTEGIEFWTGTQAEYDTLVLPDPDTLYFIKD